MSAAVMCVMFVVVGRVTVHQWGEERPWDNWTDRCTWEKVSSLIIGHDMLLLWNVNLVVNTINCLMYVFKMRFSFCTFCIVKLCWWNRICFVVIWTFTRWTFVHKVNVMMISACYLCKVTAVFSAQSNAKTILTIEILSVIRLVSQP